MIEEKTVNLSPDEVCRAIADFVEVKLKWRPSQVQVRFGKDYACAGAVCSIKIK